MLNNKKVPCIPPIFHDNKFVTDFSKQANPFNSFFAKQRSIIETVFSPHHLFPLPISTWQTLNLLRMILTDSSVDSILIKLMVMI